MKLKKIALLVTFVALVGTIFGNPVDVKTAQKAAATFAASISQTKGAQDLNLVYTATNETATLNYFYVFNSENGFVMISGDDNMIPVLAYSTESQFTTENMPEHVASFLKGYERMAQFVIDNNVVCVPENTQEWNELISGTFRATKGTDAVSPLLGENKWGQSGNTVNGTYKPLYDAKCPNRNGQYAVTGCMATVLSQIISYHKYPSKGYGSHEYTHTATEPGRVSYGKQSFNFAGTTFDFTNMPLQLTPTSSTTQINAVATLMYACGVGVEMDYGTQESGGSGSGLEEQASHVHSGQYAIKQYFNYPLASIISRNTMGDASFLATIKADLDKSLPVAVTGFDANQQNGHIFVCDGYDASNKLHLNWGWDGGMNGYYALGGFTPRSGTVAYNFNYNNQAMVNIIPGNKLTNNTALVLNTKVTTNPATIPCGNAFTVTAQLINKGGKPFSGEVRAFAAQEFMTVAALIESKTVNIAAGATSNITFSSSGITGVNAGAQAIMIEYKANGSSSWTRVAGLGAVTMPYYATFSGDTKVSTRAPYNITSTAATVWAKIEPGCATIASRGFEYKKSTDSYYKTTYETPNANNEMTKTLTGLSPNTTYKVRVWCLMNGQRQYTNDQTFTTRSTGIEDITFGDVTVYPNPAKDKLNIDLTASSQKVDQIELINSLGQSLYLINSPANTLYTIPTGKYSNGLYFIRLTSTDGVVTKKVLISK